MCDVHVSCVHTVRLAGHSPQLPVRSSYQSHCVQLHTDTETEVGRKINNLCKVT